MRGCHILLCREPVKVTVMNTPYQRWTVPGGEPSMFPYEGHGSHTLEKVNQYTYDH
jgi:hypothetical protein